MVYGAYRCLFVFVCAQERYCRVYGSNHPLWLKLCPQTGHVDGIYRRITVMYFKKVRYVLVSAHLFADEPFYMLVVL